MWKNRLELNKSNKDSNFVVNNPNKNDRYSGVCISIILIHIYLSSQVGQCDTRFALVKDKQHITNDQINGLFRQSEKNNKKN